jgi:hypothetical protein
MKTFIAAVAFVMLMSAPLAAQPYWPHYGQSPSSPNYGGGGY